jgi:epoxide hydrolase-like predicted phosphatase
VSVESEIRFVYFDLGNVLVAFDPRIACANVARLFRVDPADAEMVVYTSGLQTRFEHGQISAEQYAEYIRRHLARQGRPIPTADVLEAVSAMFQPIDSMGEVLRGVRAAGFRVGMLSNTCVAHWQWICRQSFPMLDFEFEVTILSYQIGVMKPDPGIYQVAERAADVPANQILFLDDRVENVRAARARGWKSVQCLGGAEARAALSNHGVTFERRVGS